jgi:hypothetical protein
MLTMAGSCLASWPWKSVAYNMHKTIASAVAMIGAEAKATTSIAPLFTSHIPPMKPAMNIAMKSLRPPHSHLLQPFMAFLHNEKSLLADIAPRGPMREIHKLPCARELLDLQLREIFSAKKSDFEFEKPSISLRASIISRFAITRRSHNL